MSARAVNGCVEKASPATSLSGDGHREDGTGPAPARRFCTSGGVTLRGPELETAVLERARALADLGVKPADRVMLTGENTLDLVLTMVALMHLDASVVLFDQRQPAAAYQRTARLTRAAFLVGPERHDLKLRCITYPDLPALAEARPGGPQPLGGTASVSFDAWRRRRDALITWSSGSVGAPKGVMRSGSALLDLIEATRVRMAYRPDDVMLPLVPMTHFYGMTLALLWWSVGCGLALPPLGRLDQALRVGADAGATVVDAAPSAYHSLFNLLARLPDLRTALSGVRMWCSGGAPLAASLAARFEAEFGLPLLDGYGSNEAGNIALATPANPVHCGRPLPGVDVRVIGSQDEPVPPGQLGELVLTSPFLMEGYLHSDGGISPREPSYRTQDIGFVDAEGNVAVVGRKLAVHRLGHTLYPEAIERRAEACGQQVKVVPLDDPRLGSRLVFVVADPERRGPRYWRREIGSLLAEHELPNRVLVVDEMPLGATGKPDAAALRAFVEREVTAREPRTAGADRGRQRTPSPGANGTAGSAAGTEDGQAVIMPGRREALDRVLAMLRRDPGPVIDVLTEISLRRSVDLELESSIATLAKACDEVSENQPGRVPQMAVFMPSNVLLYSYVLHVLVPSLFTERFVVRASSQVAETTRRLHELLAPVHGLPVTLADLTQRQFVEGPVRESDVVSFTGAYANGEKVRGSLGRDQLFLFFGQGINPFVVGPEADLRRAVEDLIRIRLLNSGQDCFGPDVCLVHDSRFDDFVAALTARLAQKRFGPCRDPRSDYGPLQYDAALETAMEYLFKHRERIVAGGRIHLPDRQVEPTVLVRHLTDGVAVKEFFAPVFNLVRYGSRAALEEVLTSPFFEERAMGAMVYGVDDGLVQRLAQKHTVAVDATLLEIDNGNVAFGGRGMMANYACIDGARVAEPLLVSKAVADYRGGC